MLLIFLVWSLWLCLCVCVYVYDLDFSCVRFMSVLSRLDLCYSFCFCLLTVLLLSFWWQVPADRAKRPTRLFQPFHFFSLLHFFTFSTFSTFHFFRLFRCMPFTLFGEKVKVRRGGLLLENGIKVFPITHWLPPGRIALQFIAFLGYNTHI